MLGHSQSRFHAEQALDKIPLKIEYSRARRSCTCAIRADIQSARPVQEVRRYASCRRLKIWYESRLGVLHVRRPSRS